jgi:hypothetical protein
MVLLLPEAVKEAATKRDLGVRDRVGMSLEAHPPGRDDVMHPWLRRFLAGFRFEIDYRALIYLVIYTGALAGAVLGAIISNGDITYVLLFGAGFYIAGRLAALLKYRIWQF